MSLFRSSSNISFPVLLVSSLHVSSVRFPSDAHALCFRVNLLLFFFFFSVPGQCLRGVLTESVVAHKVPVSASHCLVDSLNVNPERKKKKNPDTMMMTNSFVVIIVVVGYFRRVLVTVGSCWWWW